MHPLLPSRNKLNIKLLIAILVFTLNGVVCSFSQSIVIPATDACTCDGSVSYTSSSSSSAVFSIYDYQGALVSTINSPNGQFSLGSLCAQPYSCTMVQNGQTTTLVFNVPGGVLNPGNSTMLDICSTAGSLNLNNQLSSISAGGSWFNPVGLPIPNMLSSSVAVDGWYTYQVNSGSCSVISGVLVNQIPNANPGLTTTYLICENYAPFQLLSVVNGSPDAGGQWYSASNNQPMNGWFDPQTMDSQQFYYTISNVQGCGPVTSFLTITENQMPLPGGNASINVCGNSAPINMTNYLGGTPQAGGQWYNPSDQPISNIFDPSAQTSGAYTYLVSGQTPCTSQQSTLTITVVTDTPSGSNGSITLCSNEPPIDMINFLGGNPLSGGTWRNSTNQIVDGIFNPASEPAGNYTYHYPSIGCASQQSTLSISVQQLPNAGNDVASGLCESLGTFNLNTLLTPGATGGGVWTNSNGDVILSTITLDGSQPTQQYTYTVSNTACPSDEADFTLSVVSIQPPLSDVSISFCSTESSVDLTNYYPGFPFVTFTTMAGASVGNIFNPATQNTVTYRAINPDMGGCLGSQALITITVEQPAFQSGTESIDVCQSLMNYDLNSSSGSIDFQDGHWENQNGQQVSNLISLDFTGVRDYVFVNDQQQICATSTFSVEVHSFEQYDAGSDNSVTLCNTQQVQNLISLAGSLGSANGSWYFNNNPYSGTTFNPATDADATYQYIVPANGPCPAASSDLVIHVQHGINYDAGADLTECYGSPPASLGQQGNTGTSYQWSPSTNLSSATSAAPQVSFYAANTQPVTINYTVLVNDGVCTIQDQVSVTTLPQPVSNFPHEYQICRGESVNLSVLGNNITCNWTPVALFDNNTNQFQLVEPDVTTEVEVVITNEWQCLGFDTTLITVHQLPVVSFVPEAIPGCPPLQIHYEYYPVNGEIIIWNIPGIGNFYGNQLNTVLSDQGIYDLTLTATSAFGCSRTVHYTQMMEVYPLPTADFEMSPEVITTVDPVAKFLNTSIGAESYSWDFDGIGGSTEIFPEFEFPNSDPKTFTVCLEATNEFTCKDTICQFLPLENIYIFYAPNAFTPDDDGINDGFKPFILGFEEETYTMRIFNRWGEEIFITHDVNEPWMGNVHGGDYYVPDGIYAWRVEVKEKALANFEVFEGHVTVVR